MISIKVCFNDGDYLFTEMNCSFEDAQKYYVGKRFNLGIEKDRMVTCTGIKLLTNEDTIMATPKKKTNTIFATLTKYLQIKAQISELEKEAKELGEGLFRDPDMLPDNIMVDNTTYIKQEREPQIPVNLGMLKEAHLDETIILPMATFSMTTIKTVFGNSGEAAIKETKRFLDERAVKKTSVFYKKK